MFKNDSGSRTTVQEMFCQLRNSSIGSTSSQTFKNFMLVLDQILQGTVWPGECIGRRACFLENISSLLQKSYHKEIKIKKDYKDTQQFGVQICIA